MVRKSTRLVVTIAGMSCASAWGTTPTAWSLWEPSAHGESTPVVEPPADGGWTISFEPAVWYAGMGGTLRMPGGGPMDVDELGLDEPEPRAFGQIHLRKDRWRVSVGGFAGSRDGIVTADRDDSFAGIAFAAGDRLESSIDLASFEVLGAYQLFGDRAFARRFVGNRVVTQLEVLGGARFSWLDVEFRAEENSGTLLGRAREEHIYGEPFAGLRWTLEAYNQFTVDLQATVGGMLLGDDASIFSLEVLAGGTWRPMHNVGIKAGYRFLLHSFEDGEGSSKFEFDTYSAGLYGGVSVRF
ncbi:MAG: hypothetical protein KIT24_10075 [Phycisphaeraceae bacterium]|nr:hypothetical protein [Phycisphaeraceae bacterium]